MVQEGRDLKLGTSLGSLFKKALEKKNG
ncbi:MAG: hypothetical protein ACI82F_003818 [Planctomycetota bacterium]